MYFIVREGEILFIRLMITFSLIIKNKVHSFFRFFTIILCPDPFVVRDTGRIDRVIQYVKNNNGSGRLIFPHSESPDVSIVIPVHDQIQFTQKCLNSVLKNTSSRYELIVIDDCSSDETVTWLKSVERIRIIRNETHSGFLLSCNRCLDIARGRFIVFLNNDTIVTENWLDDLIATMTNKRIGAVGARLVFPDGTLQEAGGIVWNDGSARNYGRNDRHIRPWHNFVRPVDYCSGAALMVRTDLFHSLGGFDTRFEPAYYEDTDLCLSIWKLGYRVMYQPLSLVIHYEGSTGQKYPQKGSRTYLERNKERFFRKWREVLQQSHFNPGESNEFNARTHKSGKNILVIDYHVPTHDRDSASHRLWLILQSLSEKGHKITFLESEPKYDANSFEFLQQAGIEVLYGRHALLYRSYLEKNGKFFDLVILSRLRVALKFIRNVKRYCPNAAIIYDTVDLLFIRQPRFALITHDDKLMLYTERMRKAELSLLFKVNGILVENGIDKKILLEHCGDLPVYIVPDIYHLVPSKNHFKNRRDLLFVGGFNHHPNTECIIWFLEYIFPLICRRLPEIRVFIIGDNPPAELRSFVSDNIIIIGFSRRLQYYLDSCRVLIAPFRNGAELNGKIIQSMSAGLPLVTTTIGAEGAFLIDRYNSLIADDPQEFAERVVSLYTNQELWERISENLLKTIEEHFSWNGWQEQLDRIVTETEAGHSCKIH